jgi:hypothetical protein
MQFAIEMRDKRSPEAAPQLATAVFKLGCDAWMPGRP